MFSYDSDPRAVIHSREPTCARRETGEAVEWYAFPSSESSQKRSAKESSPVCQEVENDMFRRDQGNDNRFLIVRYLPKGLYRSGPSFGTGKTFTGWRKAWGIVGACNGIIQHHSHGHNAGFSWADEFLVYICLLLTVGEKCLECYI